MEMVTNRLSQGEGRTLLEAAAGAMVDESPEARRFVDRLSGSEGLVRGWGRHGITLSYTHLVQG